MSPHPCAAHTCTTTEATECPQRNQPGVTMSSIKTLLEWLDDVVGDVEEELQLEKTRSRTVAQQTKQERPHWPDVGLSRLEVYVVRGTGI
jgi:hypothetical protein